MDLLLKVAIKIEKKREGLIELKQLRNIYTGCHQDLTWLGVRFILPYDQFCCYSVDILTKIPALKFMIFTTVMRSTSFLQIHCQFCNHMIFMHINFQMFVLCHLLII